MPATDAGPRPVEARLRIGAAAAVVVLPTILAFFSGGFFDEPRLVAGVLVWLGVAALALAGWLRLPRVPAGRLAVAGLALLSVWILVSLAWAPLAGRALDDGQRALLYLGTLLVAVSVLRPRAVARLVEPGLAAGALVVVGYALAGRLLPGIVSETAGRQALGRLEQPLTYWNALGVLAAMGLVLSARIAGDGQRPARLRVPACAAAAPLGAGLYLTFSRGAIAAAVVGIVALLALAPRRDELPHTGLAVVAAVAGGLTVAFFPHVTDPRGVSVSGQGAAAFALLLSVTAATALAAAGLRGARGEAREGAVAPGRVGLAVIAVVLLAALAVTGLGGERVGREPASGATARRLTSVDSQRYDYWREAGRQFADHPLAGDGSGSFLVRWRQERPRDSVPAADAHSLYVETAAELGSVGLAFLALLFGGVASAALAAVRRDRLLAAGPVAALLAWAVHAGLDWDWEMPAVTLVAVLLAGTLIARDEEALHGH